MIVEGSAWLIDFQGMRPGLPQYDLASLLLDPYVSLKPNEREELMGFYKRLARRSGRNVAEDLRKYFIGVRCSVLCRLWVPMDF